MKFFSDAWDTVKDAFSGDVDPLVKALTDPIGNYAIEKAKDLEDWEPGWKDQVTQQERSASERMAPTWTNPSVRGAKWYGGNSAGATAGRKAAQTEMLGTKTKQAPAYWANLVNQAAQISGQSKAIYNNNSTPYWQTYAAAQASGSINSWLNNNKNPQTSYVDTQPAGYGGTDSAYSPYGNEQSTATKRWYADDSSDYYDTLYGSEFYTY